MIPDYYLAFRFLVLYQTWCHEAVQRHERAESVVTEMFEILLAAETKTKAQRRRKSADSYIRLPRKRPALSYCFTTCGRSPPSPRIAAANVSEVQVTGGPWWIPSLYCPRSAPECYQLST